MTLDDSKLNLSGCAGAESTYHADVFLKDEQEFDLAGFHIRVLFTPGHTVGGCCYYFAYQDALFSGDTLFAQSVGRTDFPKGSASALIRGIKEKILPLPDEVTVCTGHSGTTAIGTGRRFDTIHICKRMIRETRGFPDFCRSKDAYDIMNPIGFILEVPAELRMRRKQRIKMI